MVGSKNYVGLIFELIWLDFCRFLRAHSELCNRKKWQKDFKSNKKQPKWKKIGSELKNRIFRTYLNSSEKLFSVVFAWNSKLLAALLATSRKNAATILGLHTQAETMLVDALAIVGLECSFHCYLSICFSFFIAEIHSCSCLKQRFACFKDRQTISSKVHPFELS